MRSAISALLGRAPRSDLSTPLGPVRPWDAPHPLPPTFPEADVARIRREEAIERAVITRSLAVARRLLVTVPYEARVRTWYAPDAPPTSCTVGHSGTFADIEAICARLNASRRTGVPDDYRAVPCVPWYAGDAQAAATLVPHFAPGGRWAAHYRTFQTALAAALLQGRTTSLETLVAIFTTEPARVAWATTTAMLEALGDAPEPWPFPDGP